MKKDRAQMDGEERERAELDAQIARARAAEGEKKIEDVGLQKKEGEKISLSFAAPAPTPVTEGTSENAGTTADTSTPSSITSEPKPAIGTIGSKPAPTSIAVNPLKRPAPVNVFKAAKASKTDSASDAASTNGGGKKFMSEAERLMKEDLARKTMRGGPGGGGGGYQGAGPRRTGDGGRRFVLQ
jgi:DNA/RNA-binding protein KIN17